LSDEFNMIHVGLAIKKLSDEDSYLSNVVTHIIRHEDSNFTG